MKEQISKSLVVDIFIQIKISFQAFFFQGEFKKGEGEKESRYDWRCVKVRQFLRFRGFLAFLFMEGF